MGSCVQASVDAAAFGRSTRRFGSSGAGEHVRARPAIFPVAGSPDPGNHSPLLSPDPGNNPPLPSPDPGNDLAAPGTPR